MDNDQKLTLLLRWIYRVMKFALGNFKRDFPEIAKREDYGKED